MSSSDIGPVRSTYTLEERLGEGSYGVVYKIKLVDGSQHALKTFDIIKNQGVKIPGEIDILSRSRHPNIMYSESLVDVDRSQIRRTSRLAPPETDQITPSLGVVMPLAITDLRKYIYTNRKVTDLPTKRKLAFDLMAGLFYLHQQRIVHADIKPDNTLIFPGPVLKISDFGLSLRVGPNRSRVFNLTFGIGTRGYQPPENFRIKGSQTITTKFDIWSAGMTLIYIYSLNTPSRLKIETRQQAILAFNDTNRKRYLTQLINNPGLSVLVDLLDHMLDPNTNRRYNISQVMTHPFFSGLTSPIGNVLNPHLVATKTPRIEYYYGFYIIVQLGLKYNTYTETVFLAGDLFQRSLHLIDDDSGMLPILNMVIATWALAYRIIEFNLSYKIPDIIHQINRIITDVKHAGINITYIGASGTLLDQLVVSQRKLVQQFGGILYRPYSLYLNRCQTRLASGFDFLTNIFMYPWIDFINWSTSRCPQCPQGCPIKDKFRDFYPTTEYYSLVGQDLSLRAVYKNDYDGYYAQYKTRIDVVQL